MRRPPKVKTVRSQPRKKQGGRITSDRRELFGVEFRCPDPTIDYSTMSGLLRQQVVEAMSEIQMWDLKVGFISIRKKWKGFEVTARTRPGESITCTDGTRKTTVKIGPCRHCSGFVTTKAINNAYITKHDKECPVSIVEEVMHS